MRPVEVCGADTWNQILLNLPEPHILQTWQWGQSKIQNGWLPKFFVWRDGESAVVAAAMILERELRTPFGLSFRVLYCPKGPAMLWTNKTLLSNVLTDLENYAQKQKAIFLKIDPDVLLGTGTSAEDAESQNPEGSAIREMLIERGWRFSSDQIQFRNTVVIDLKQTEPELLARMKQKTRYNIRLAERKGVTVREGGVDDLQMLYQMYAVTAVRDGFVIRHKEYYIALWRSFFEAGMARFLIAEYEQKPIAAVVLFHFAGVMRYMFGMSLEVQRDLMPNYLLQWEAMRLGQSLGCHSYDMWGAPDVFDQSDSMWGVYRFKEGFNGTTVRHIGAWDYIARPIFYKFYTKTLPRVLDLMRFRGKKENRKQAY
ncbi:MAG TPA: peptidoglycan bridge formation glycyltransferase FemA/FemB family protein [Anaerolineaceae bacterium]|nr:peptidoglycan bridge formation glycyltransferase FemA/FemB family protein [Anaerolineaceae bacterium]